MITVHHLDHSRSQRVLWLLEELGLPYEIKSYQRDPRTMLAPPQLKAVHPLGKSPVITDDGVTVAESGAIIEYLVGRYGQGRLAPASGTPDRMQYTYFLHYAEGSLMPIMVMTLVFNRIASGPMPFFAKPIARGIVGQVRKIFLGPQTKLHLEFLEAHLARHAWFAGEEFSAADIQMSFPVEALFARGDAASSYPKLAAYMQRYRAREAWQRASAKGGPQGPLG